MAAYQNVIIYQNTGSILEAGRPTLGRKEEGATLVPGTVKLHRHRGETKGLNKDQEGRKLGLELAADESW